MLSVPRRSNDGSHRTPAFAPICHCFLLICDLAINTTPPHPIEHSEAGPSLIRRCHLSQELQSPSSISSVERYLEDENLIRPGSPSSEVLVHPLVEIDPMSASSSGIRPVYSANEQLDDPFHSPKRLAHFQLNSAMPAPPYKPSTPRQKLSLSNNNNYENSKQHPPPTSQELWTTGTSEPRSDQQPPPKRRPKKQSQQKQSSPKATGTLLPVPFVHTQVELEFPNRDFNLSPENHHIPLASHIKSDMQVKKLLENFLMSDQWLEMGESEAFFVLAHLDQYGETRILSELPQELATQAKCATSLAMLKNTFKTHLASMIDTLTILRASSTATDEDYFRFLKLYDASLYLPDQAYNNFIDAVHQDFLLETDFNGIIEKYVTEAEKRAGQCLENILIRTQYPLGSPFVALKQLEMIRSAPNFYMAKIRPMLYESLSKRLRASEGLKTMSHSEWSSNQQESFLSDQINNIYSRILRDSSDGLEARLRANFQELDQELSRQNTSPRTIDNINSSFRELEGIYSDHAALYGSVLEQVLDEIGWDHRTQAEQAILAATVELRTQAIWQAFLGGEIATQAGLSFSQHMLHLGQSLHLDEPYCTFEGPQIHNDYKMFLGIPSDVKDLASRVLGQEYYERIGLLALVTQTPKFHNDHLDFNMIRQWLRRGISAPRMISWTRLFEFVESYARSDPITLVLSQSEESKLRQLLLNLPHVLENPMTELQNSTWKFSFEFQELTHSFHIHQSTLLLWSNCLQQLLKLYN